MIDLVWLIPGIMFLAALVNGLGVRKLGKVAGYVSVAAMATTFLLSVAIFLQVKGEHVHVGFHDEAHSEVAAEDHSAAAHGEGHEAADMAYWNSLSHDAQANMKSQYHFVRSNPEDPKPWDTDFRDGQGGYVKLWTWIDIPGALGTGRDFVVDLAFHVDQLTSVFLIFISFVGTLVFLYATGYMREEHHGKVELDPGYARFFSYLALFAGSMYTLILGSNMIVMFIGWEGVGLCSYLLIGYFFEKQFNEKLSCSDAGKKAFVVNRIGDFGLLIGIFLLFWGVGTVDFQELIHAFTIGAVPASFMYGGALVTAATLLMFLGATGKSAQIPLFTWLPDAMAGPTPVSALIHAATMVTAGVYMLARLNVLYMFSPDTMVVVAIIGALTAFVAAYVGLTQRGIKKILAYSTVSQLGYMFLAMGVGAFASGIFHVFTHAFFKACLFLAAGSIIHALHHEEDVFKMGGLFKKMPKTAISYGIATLAIAGVVPFAGFFSKDEILYFAYVAGQGSNLHMALWVLGIITAAFTAFYMGRSFVLAFMGKTRMSDEKYSHVHESPISMSGVLIVLAIASAFVGLLNVPSGLINLGAYNELFHHFLAPITDRGAMLVADGIFNTNSANAVLGPVIIAELMNNGMLYADYHGPEIVLAVVSVAIALGGLGLAFFLYGSGNLDRAKNLGANPLLKPFWAISWNAWGWDQFYDLVFVKMLMRVYSAVLWVDKTIVDGTVNGVGKLSRGLGHEFRKLQNGQVQVYGLVMFIGICLFLLYFTLGLGSFLEKDSVKVAPRTDVPALSTAPQDLTLNDRDDVALVGYVAIDEN